MLQELNDILRIGFFDGIRWFPMVLTVGILFKYLKFIDVSIDGIVVISSICFTFLWNGTQSLFISFSCTALVAIVSYSFVSFLIYELKINGILAGIIFTLILHSLSVILIGESLSLDYSRLPFLNSTISTLIIAISLAVIIEFFFRSNIGIKIKVASDNFNVNVPSNPRILILTIYVIAGFILSIGVVIYTSNLGLSRSGGGFEFLITSLSSFLFIDRIIDILVGAISKSQKGYSFKWYLIFSTTQSPVFKAIIGSVLFQIIVLMIIYYTANPTLWKLIFGLALLFTVAKPGTKIQNSKRQSFCDKNLNGVFLTDLSFNYDNGYEKREVFRNLNCHFEKGINIVWGDNGAGKTSLLKLLSGELKPAAGFIIKDGMHITDKDKNKRRVFYITQNPYSSLSIDSTVYENIIASKRFKYRDWLKIPSIKDSLSSLNIILRRNHNNGFEINDSFGVQKVSNLSGGQAQKLNLFISNVSDADIILADEPTSGIDAYNF